MPVLASGTMTGAPASHDKPHSRWRWPDRRLMRILLAAAGAIYAIVFIALNRTRVRIHFVFFTVSSRVWVGLLVCLALGALLGHAGGVYRRRRTARVERPARAGGYARPDLRGGGGWRLAAGGGSGPGRGGLLARRLSLAGRRPGGGGGWRAGRRGSHARRLSLAGRRLAAGGGPGPRR